MKHAQDLNAKYLLDLQPDRMLAFYRDRAGLPQQGEGTQPAPRIDGRPGRQGTNWFSYDVPVDPSRPMALVVTYHRDSRRPRRFEIHVDGQKLADVNLEGSSEPRFEDVEYAIPPALVQRKARVTVRFHGAQIGPVYGVRMIRWEGGVRSRLLGSDLDFLAQQFWQDLSVSA